MSDFVKWPSIENHYRQKTINYFFDLFPELQDEVFVATEKLHGANASFLVAPDGTRRMASRTRWLDPEASFQGQSVQGLLDKYAPILDALQDRSREGGIAHRLFGELIGPKIQKGVDYGPEVQIVFFGLMVDNRLWSFEGLYYLFGEYVTRFKIDGHIRAWAESDLIVPILGLGTWDAIMEMDIAVDSALSPGGTEDGTNICEGVVIQPYRRVFRDNSGSTFMLKKKNEAFKEKEKVKKPRAPEDPEVAKLNAEFYSYVTGQRVQAVFSKEGKIERPQQIGDYIRWVLQDAKEDFLKDHGEAFEALDAGQQKRVLNVGSKIANILKGYL